MLRASGPLAEHREQLMLFGQFVGSWDLDSKWYAQDRVARTARGEWHFQWILGGRGIQDAIFTSGAPAHEFGTTIRCYDKELDAWHVSFMQPSGGEYVNLLARKAGDRIVLEDQGPDPKRRERWSFNDIRPESFLWRGEASFDGGKSWIVEQEMQARRKVPALG